MNEPPMAEGTRLAATERRTIDRVVEELANRKDDWIRCGLPERVGYLESCIEGVLAVAEDWATETCRHGGIDPGAALAGEAWISGPMVTIDGMQQYAHTLRQGGQPVPRSTRETQDGQIVARVFPRTLAERFLHHNMLAEVWIEPGRPASQGRIYRDKDAGRFPTGRVALVLGAGNISSIGPLDVMYKLFVEDQVVVLKMHPVNDYLGDLFERAFAPLIRDRYLSVVHGGAEVGKYLCRHPRVDSVHLTGSDRTHDAIVWGADEDQAARKAAGMPLLDKTITSELGCVTPILVVPGPWSRSDIDYQARHIAGMISHNASFNCASAQVLVLARGWAERAAFLRALGHALSRTPPRRAYYPGARERYVSFLGHYPQARVLGDERVDAVPWTLIPDVSADADELVLSREAFCGLVAEVSVDAASAPEFLERAVPLCNDRIWGTLSCTMLVDRTTRRRHGQAIEHAISRLRYGSIGVNVWSGVNYGLTCTSWGAFPGHSLERIESGRGVVHNALLFDHPQKSVVWSHFRIRPKPIWFADHRTLDVLGRHLTRFAARGSPWDLLRVALAGLRG